VEATERPSLDSAGPKQGHPRQECAEGEWNQRDDQQQVISVGVSAARYDKQFLSTWTGSARRKKPGVASNAQKGGVLPYAALQQARGRNEIHIYINDVADGNDRVVVLAMLRVQRIEP
jgi:hypothetical protein